MKIADIKAEVVYWYDTRQDWGTWLTSSYDRGPVMRIDSKRYELTGSIWSINRQGREDPKGRYAAFRKVKEDGSPEDGSDADRIYYLTSAHIRDTMVNVRARYDRQKAADDAAEQERARQAAEKAQEAADLRARLEALGIDSIRVGSTSGQGYNAGVPHVTVDLGYSPEKVLADLLDRLERGVHAERELTARKRDMTPDPDWADRLANGAYEH